MAKKSKIGIELEGKDRASAKVKKVDKSLDKAGKTAKTTGSKFGGLAGKMKTLVAGFGILAGAGGIMGAVAGFKKLIDASSKQEEIFRKLETAVDLSGAGYEKNKERIDDFLSSLQATTKYGDTDAAPALQRITMLTGSLEKGFEGTKIAADMASAGLFDLKTASTYVSMAMAGEVTMLGRYIPQLKTTYGLIDMNTSATEKWAIAKELMNEKFGGAAERDLNTYVDSSAQLKNYLADIAERAGDVLTKPLAPFFRDITESLKDFIDSGGMETIEGMASVIATVLQPAMLAIKLAMDSFITDIERLKAAGEEEMAWAKSDADIFDDLSGSQEKAGESTFDLAGYIRDATKDMDALAKSTLNYLLTEAALTDAHIAFQRVIGKEKPKDITPDYEPAKAVTKEFYEFQVGETRKAADQAIEMIGQVSEYEKEIYTERLATLGEWLERNLEAQAILATANDTFWQLVVRGDMTGSEKRKAIWNSTRSVIMSIIADTVKAEILADFAVSKAAIKLVTSNLAAAASKIFKAHAGIPFAGVAIAAGLIAAMYATMKGLGAFESGYPYVHKAGLYYLHQGEGVIPRTENINYGGNRVENVFNVVVTSEETLPMMEAWADEVLLPQIKDLIEKRKLG